MTYRFWDYKNPPKMTEGENPYWTPEERKQYMVPSESAASQ